MVVLWFVIKKDQPPQRGMKNCLTAGHIGSLLFNLQEERKLRPSIGAYGICPSSDVYSAASSAPVNERCYWNEVIWRHYLSGDISKRLLDIEEANLRDRISWELKTKEESPKKNQNEGNWHEPPLLKQEEKIQ